MRGKILEQAKAWWHLYDNVCQFPCYLEAWYLALIQYCIRLKKKKFCLKAAPTFVFWCTFDSAKFKLRPTPLKHFEQQTSSTLYSVFYLCSSKNQVPYFILNKVVTDSNLTRLLLRKKKKKTHLGQIFQSITSFETTVLWDVEFFFFLFFFFFF